MGLKWDVDPLTSVSGSESTEEVCLNVAFVAWSDRAEL